MKSTPTRFFTTSLLTFITALFFCTAPLFSQPSDVTITLEVNAQDLFESQGNLNKKKIEDQCRIKDVRNGQLNMSDFGRVKQHETTVRSNDDVEWVIVSLDEGFTVSIDQITPILSGKQKNFFRKLVLNAQNGKVREKVKDLTFSPGASKKDKSYPYQVFFTITHNGEAKPYFVDPKLKGGDD